MAIAIEDIQAENDVQQQTTDHEHLEHALKILREKMPRYDFEPRDEWERGLLESIRDWGVSFTDLEVSREGLYE